MATIIDVYHGWSSENGQLKPPTWSEPFPSGASAADIATVVFNRESNRLLGSVPFETGSELHRHIESMIEIALQNLGSETAVASNLLTVRINRT
ncbi:hypothetical protein AXK56_20725 [Tsukamurella pulmonis]|uniref:Uncharacterized protein n=1 Tax=Tsukamurella pulmonis TaxID=47312 RepID=A0A1H1H5Z0_9ACTN|nr:hypothetical protein [Tsukamurella pulmonis]KXO95011.1 hypothetical protein AXK56_20725 [Tsukamurella pulmonis]SDR20867.1 hypothetical protein SAMN04489765_3845 [Tsukamurella pulmonis]SUP15855.1 Uncharacterised protein [Tsukamurella pulmonis]